MAHSWLTLNLSYDDKLSNEQREEYNESLCSNIPESAIIKMPCLIALPLINGHSAWFYFLFLKIFIRNTGQNPLVLIGLLLEGCQIARTYNVKGNLQAACMHWLRQIAFGFSASLHPTTLAERSCVMNSHQNGLMTEFGQTLEPKLSRLLSRTGSLRYSLPVS